MANDYHESTSEMSQKDRDIVRAIVSLKEEIDAVDCYHQRVATSSNEELNRLLLHNQHEEMEHAIMLLEWLRRNQDGWDEQMRTYLFTNKDLTKVEEDAESGESSKASSDEDLGIGEL